MITRKVMAFAVAFLMLAVGCAAFLGEQSSDADPGSEYSLTLNVVGCDPSCVQLKIAPTQLTSEITESGQTTSSLGMTKTKGTVISENKAEAGKTIGVWNTITEFREESLTSIEITCGGQDVKWCHDSWKYYFIMPEGDTTVTVTYKTVHLTVGSTDHVSSCKLSVGNTTRVGDYYKAGETVTVIPTMETDDYQLNSLTVDSQLATTSGKTLTIKTIESPTEMQIGLNVGEKEFSVYVTGAGNAGAFIGGTASASKSMAKQGETIVLTVTPDAGYAIKSITDIFGLVQDLTKDSTSFQMPAGSVGIQVEFVLSDYTITIPEVVGGTVVASQYTANYGDEITLTVTPNTKYFLKSLSSNDVALTKESRTFTMPDKDVTITPEFEQMAQLSCTPTQSSGKVILDITVAASIGAGMADPMFLIAGTYGDDIVINAYSHIKVGEDHTERVALSSFGLQDVFVQLVDGISSDPTGYYCMYSVSSGA